MSQLALTGAMMGLLVAGIAYLSAHQPAPITIRPEPARVAPFQLKPSPSPELSGVLGGRALAPPPAPTQTEEPRTDPVLPARPAPVCRPDARRACTLAGKPGIEECDWRGQWSECGLVTQCSPGQRLTCGDPAWLPRYAGRCIVSDHRWVFHSCDTPLALSFDGAPVTFTDAAGVFDLRADGSPPRTSRWLSPATPWLAVDLDHSGAIEDARELFGSATVLPSGARAHHGFEALAAHDDDHDGQITARDAIWPRLVLWSDTNQDRRSSPDELTPLAARGIVAIALSFREQPRCERGACEVERAGFRFVDEQGRERQGAVVDVHFASHD